MYGFFKEILFKIGSLDQPNYSLKIKLLILTNLNFDLLKNTNIEYVWQMAADCEFI